MNWGTWTSCSACTDGPSPGGRALLAWLLETYTQGHSQGIFNCRPVRGSTSLSIHACGRAVDFALPVVNGRGNPVGHEIVRRLGEHGQRLGIQAIIFDRTIFSRVSPDGRRYNGVHPHYDHLHIELTSAAGALLTLATLRAVLGDDDMADPRFDDETAAWLNAFSDEARRMGSTDGRATAHWLLRFFRGVRDVFRDN